MPAAKKAVEEVIEQNDLSTPVDKTVPLIYDRMANVMNDINAIVKTKQGGVSYAFRSIEDIMNALHPILCQWGVVVIPHEITFLDNQRFLNNNNKNSFQAILRIKYRFYTTDGSFIECEVAAESVDYSDKATQQAMSYCYKDVLQKSFCIPTVDLQYDGDGAQPDRSTEKPAPKQGRLDNIPKLSDRPSVPTTVNVSNQPSPNEPPFPTHTGGAASQEPPTGNSVIEQAKEEAGADLMPEAAWPMVRGKLLKFNLTDQQFFDWRVKTLRKAGRKVPENIGLLTKDSGEFLYKVAAKSDKLGELLYELPS